MGQDFFNPHHIKQNAGQQNKVKQQKGHHVEQMILERVQDHFDDGFEQLFKLQFKIVALQKFDALVHHVSIFSA